MAQVEAAQGQTVSVKPILEVFMIARTVFLLLLAATAAAQTVSPGLERANPQMRKDVPRREVQQRVEEFLKKLGNRDVAGIREMFAPKALIVVARQRDGSFVNTYQTGAEFLAEFEKNRNDPPFEEPIRNVMVSVDSGHLAYVRANFRVVRDGKLVSSGVDHFTLLKESDGWKIAVIAYTSLPAAR
jgi:ketosteroid isomerase-like protein